LFILDRELAQRKGEEEGEAEAEGCTARSANVIGAGKARGSVTRPFDSLSNYLILNEFLVS
jgi:hypothetical protein